MEDLVRRRAGLEHEVVDAPSAIAPRMMPARKGQSTVGRDEQRAFRLRVKPAGPVEQAVAWTERRLSAEHESDVGALGSQPVEPSTASSTPLARSIR